MIVLMTAPSKATIADVAAEAGVSLATVSRVANGSAPVNEDKRERVKAAMARLGYRPSAAARFLATRQRDVIAVVAGNTYRYGYAETLRGLEEAARAAGFSVMITVIESDERPEIDRAIRNTIGQPLAGVAVLKFDSFGVAALERIPVDLPLVAVSGLHDTAVTQALIDEEHAAEELVDHLLALGHSTVHYVHVPTSGKEDGRTAGWRNALRRANRPVPEPVAATWDPSSGIPIGAALAQQDDVTAVFCGNDEIAMGVIRGISQAGRRVPEDVSVAGFDDHPLARIVQPALTTVAQDFAALGRRGFELLLDVIDGETPGSTVLERPLLVIRDSTAPPPRP